MTDQEMDNIDFIQKLVYKIDNLVTRVDELEDLIDQTNQRINKGLALRCYDIEQKIAEIEKKVWEKDD